MKKESAFARALRAVNHYVVFFLLIGFVISCCTMLFVSVLMGTLGIVLTEETVAAAAKLTFANVLLLSLVCTLIDGLRRRLTVRKPVDIIINAARRITEGDFTVRIPHVRTPSSEDGFNEIIDCLNTMAEELSGIETLRTDFIANVSHELKTPLAVMGSYGRLLADPKLTDEERAEYSAAVTSAASRLAGLVDNILKLNKLENQQIFPKAVSFDLSEQLCQCLLAFEDVWEARGINIETDIPDGVTVKSDSQLLELVWNNLISNALKFTPRGGTVTLRLEERSSCVAVSVSDTGCGISREVGGKIFDKFYQGDTSHATRGNGLGLALVKRVIDIISGDISVDSEVGRGSTFTVKIRR